MRKTISIIFEKVVDLFSPFLLYLLIWTGAFMGLVESKNTFLAILLFLSGIAWAYKEWCDTKQNLNGRQNT